MIETMKTLTPEYLNVSELKSTAAGFPWFKALVKSSTSKTASNGKPFVDVELADKTGTIAAKMWDTETGPPAGQVIIARGKLNVWNDQKQIVLAGWDVDEEADLAEYVQSSFVPSQELFDGLCELLHGRCDDGVAVLVENILLTHHTKLLTCPAAKGNHHARHGGLLEHTHSMVMLAIDICQHYRSRYETHIVDESLLITGIVLHDLGKIHELSGPLGTEYTDTGRLVGHIPHGLLMLERALLDNPGLVDDETADRLRHMILSHHGRLEWGSPVEPCTPEAIILHHLDMLDSRFDALATAVKESSAGARWTAPSRALGGKAVYLGTSNAIQITTETNEVNEVQS